MPFCCHVEWEYGGLSFLFSRVCSLLCLWYLVGEVSAVLFCFSSSDQGSDIEACGMHTPRGAHQTSLSSWGAWSTLMVPATETVETVGTAPR